MAWFKAHHPAAFYCAWLTLHAEAVELAAVMAGEAGVLKRIREIKALRESGEGTAKLETASGALVVCLEALLRGLNFARVDVMRSHALRFAPVDLGGLLPPLVAVPGLGATVAERIASERLGPAFRSVEDFADRCGVNKKVVEALTVAGSLEHLPRTNQTELF
jgi:DNA polymerase-3 subunit alpha (Gram-positive type)